ncbi:MAG: hypothetical protein VB912_01900, partial [Pirellulaceae bacterium]
MQWQSFFDRKQQATLMVVALVAWVWTAVIVDWLWVFYLPVIIQYVILGLITVASGGWLAMTYEKYSAKTVWFWLVLTVTFPVFWQFSLYNCHHFGLELLSVYVARFGLAILFLIGLIWNVWGLEQIAQRIETLRRQQREFDLGAVLQKKRRRTRAKTWNPLDPEA